MHDIFIDLMKQPLARAAGPVAKLIAKEEKLATLKLPSGEVRLISPKLVTSTAFDGYTGI